MTYSEFNLGDDGFTQRLVRHKATQLVCLRLFSTSDREDIEQDLLLHVLENILKHDPSRGHSNAFIKTIVERRTATIAKRRPVKKHAHKPIASLNVSTRASESEETELGGVLTEKALYSRAGRRHISDMGRSDWEHDLTDVIATFPTHYQTLVTLLHTHKVSEAAREMNVPRTTVSSWKTNIKEQFLKAGLGESFCFLSSSRAGNR